MQMFSEIYLGGDTVPGSNKGLGGEVMRLWADTYLLQKMDPLQKRLFDWWTGEGFFYVSNFKDTSDGMSAELMLLLGGSAYGIVRDGSDSNDVWPQIDAKKKAGWDMLPFGDNGYYLLRDTEDNRTRVNELLEENIRSFRLINFTGKEMNGDKVLKSVVVVLNRKR